MSMKLQMLLCTSGTSNIASIIWISNEKTLWIKWFTKPGSQVNCFLNPVIYCNIWHVISFCKRLRVSCASMLHLLQSLERKKTQQSMKDCKKDKTLLDSPLQPSFHTKQNKEGHWNQNFEVQPRQKHENPPSRLG